MKSLKVIALLLAMVMILGSLAGCSKDDEAAGGSAKLTVILVLEDKTEEKHEITFTAGKNLREALFEGGLIQEDQMAEMFIVTINGHSANYLDGVTWMVKNDKGEQIMGMVDEIIPEDGQTIYMEYIVVPNFD